MGFQMLRHLHRTFIALSAIDEETLTRLYAEFIFLRFVSITVGVKLDPFRIFFLCPNADITMTLCCLDNSSASIVTCFPTPLSNGSKIEVIKQIFIELYLHC